MVTEMTQYNNAFFDAFKQFADKDAFANFQKNFNFGNQDSSQYSELAQKNLDAMMKAGQISAENAQAIMRRVGEVVQKQLGEATEAVRDIMSSSNPEHAMQKGQQFAKNAATNAIHNSKEMVEMSSKSVMEVFDIYGKRFAENMDTAVAQQKKK